MRSRLLRLARCGAWAIVAFSLLGGSGGSMVSKDEGEMSITDAYFHASQVNDLPVLYLSCTFLFALRVRRNEFLGTVGIKEFKEGMCIGNSFLSRGSCRREWSTHSGDKFQTRRRPAEGLS